MQRRFIQYAFIIFLFALSGEGIASSPKKSTKLLWDNWYTVTIGADLAGKKGMHYSYYNEKVEKVGDRLRMQVHIWKKEDGFLNEEHTGAFAEDTNELKPLFYNFNQTYRSTIASIDGSIDAKNLLTARVKQGSKDLGEFRRQIPTGAIFSVFFPVWFQKNMGKIMDLKGPVAFTTIQEDNIQQEFKMVTGNVRIEKPDDFAVKKNLIKLNVYYQDYSSNWWVKASGEAVQIFIPGRNLLIESTSESNAKKFLN